MMNLMGSEKQVKWAEEIREQYAAKAAALIKIEEITRNLEKEGPSYTHHIDRNEEFIVNFVSISILGMGRSRRDKWIDEKDDQMEAEGVEKKGRYRLAEADFIKMIREELERILDTEDTARYWIDLSLKNR